MGWREDLSGIMGTALIPRLRNLGILGEEHSSTGVSKMLESLRADRAAQEEAASRLHTQGEQFLSDREVNRIREDQPTTMLQHVSPYKMEGGYSFNEGFFGKGEGGAAFGPGFYHTIAEGENPVSTKYQDQFIARAQPTLSPVAFPNFDVGPTRMNQAQLEQYVKTQGPQRAALDQFKAGGGGNAWGVPNRLGNMITEMSTSGKSPEEYLLQKKMEGWSDSDLLTLAAAIDKLPMPFKHNPSRVSRYDVLLTDDINKSVNLDTSIGGQAPEVKAKLRAVEQGLPGASDIYHMQGKVPGLFGGGSTNLTNLNLPPEMIADLAKQEPGRVMSQADWLSRPEQSANVVFSNAATGQWSPEMRRQAMKAQGIPGATAASGTLMTPGVQWEEKFRNFIGYDASKLLIIRRHGIKGALAAGVITPEMADQLRQHGAPEEGEG